MPFQQRRKVEIHAHCPRCGHEQRFVSVETNHLLHLVLTIFTLGLWFVCWISLCVSKLMRPWRCEHCGWHKPEFRHIDNQTLSATRELPDPNICHTMSFAHAGALAKCLVACPTACRYAMGYEGGHLCTHPNWKDFLKN
jgi:rubredoxin